MLDMIKALTILLKHGDVAYPFTAEHDSIYIRPLSMDFSEEELKQLQDLGVYRSEEFEDAFMMYV